MCVNDGQGSRANRVASPLSATGVPGTFHRGYGPPVVHDQDRSLKALTARYAADYASLLLGVRAPAEPLHLEPQDRALPALSREVDFVARVQLQGRPVLLLLEFQTRWAADVPLRMAEYTLRLHRRYALPVLAAVVVLRRGGVLRDRWQMGVGAVRTLRCQFRLIRLWRHPVQAVIAPGLVGLYPLLPVMNWGSLSREAGLALSRQLIEAQIPPGEPRQDALASLRIFAGTVHRAEVVHRILGGGAQMIDSPVFAEFVEEGRALGRLEARRSDIVAVLEARFGPVPAAITAHVDRLTDLALLSSHNRRAAVVASLEAFAQELAAANP